MLTSYIKERLSRPILSEIEEKQPLNVPKISVLEKLKTYKPGELYLNDSDSSDDDIQDPFKGLKIRANMDRLFKKTKKRLSQLEKNMHLMSSFSEDFKKAMDEVKDELEIKASDTYYDDINKIKETLREARQRKDLPKNMEDKLDNLFMHSGFNCDFDLDIHTPRRLSLSDEKTDETEKEDVKEEKDKGKENGDNNTSSSSYDSELDVMSGVWNMFNTSEDLVCTTPNYDAYRQQTPHWLDRETVPWEEFDKARFKCVNWMKNNEEKF